MTPLVLDSVYGQLRDEGASEHKIRKADRLLSAGSIVPFDTGGW